MTFTELANKIAADIPEGWTLRIEIERGAGVVKVYSPAGEGIGSHSVEPGLSDLENRIQEMLAYAIEHQGSCRIIAAEIDFKTMIVPMSEIVSKCKHIWEHPEKYSSYAAGSEDAWYRFLKYLWVRMPDGTDKRLADIAEKGEI